MPLSLLKCPVRENSRKMDLWQFGLILLFSFAVDLTESTDFYSLTVNDLRGNNVPMSVFKGKVSVYRNGLLTYFQCWVNQSFSFSPSYLAVSSIFAK